MQHRQTPRDNYIQAEVQTATPQKLQLLLVEAAIKNIHRTKHAWSEQKFDVGLDTLTRAQDIIAEILSSLDVKGNPDIAKQLASIYLFIFRRLAESGMSNDEEKLDDALRVLNAERETWRLVCEKFGATVGGGNDGMQASKLTRQSAEYTPSANISANTAANASASLNLSIRANQPGKTQVLVPPGGSATSSAPSATFSRPTGFGPGVRPLGTSPIQTSNSLATPKTPQVQGIQTYSSGNSPQVKPNTVPNSPQNEITQSTPQGGQQKASSPSPVAPSSRTGNNWEV